MTDFPALYASDTPDDFNPSSQRFGVLFWLFSHLRLLDFRHPTRRATEFSGKAIEKSFLQQIHELLSTFWWVQNLRKSTKISNNYALSRNWDTMFYGTVRCRYTFVWNYIKQKKYIYLWTKHYFSDWRVECSPGCTENEWRLVKFPIISLMIFSLRNKGWTKGAKYGIFFILVWLV